MKDWREIRAVLFDLDGVLVDSFHAWFSAFNDTQRKFGKEPLSREEFLDRCWGLELDAIMRKVGLGSECTEHCRKKYLDHIDEVRIFPESRHVLKSINERKGLVTSTSSDPTYKLLNRFALKKYFDAIVTGDDVEKPKPAPEPVLRGCEILEVEPREAIFVGDSKSDVKAGRGAGCRVIGLKVEGDLKIERLSELLEVLSEPR